MKKLLTAAFLLSLLSCSGKEEYDLCVYGGSSAGVMAAAAAARQGLDVVVIEPSVRVGGLTTGGLGYTDIGNKQVVRGLALDFYRRLGKHYGSLEQWTFEPSAALSVMEEYLAHPSIKTITSHHLAAVQKEGTRIVRIRVAGADTLSIRAKWFIDASYEGDLMAFSGVSYRVGREDNSEYGESWNGVQMLSGHQFPDGVDPYVVPGHPESGLLPGIQQGGELPAGVGDTLLQAYNYRICLTDSLENRIPLERPQGYDSSRYELLRRLYAAQPGITEVNRYFIWSAMPGRKTDVNNRGAFSTDMIGENWDYASASWERRQEILRAHKDYTLGLLYFTAHDPSVPRPLQEFVARWGLPKDEFQENGHWTPQLYVRECRRLVGQYVATQADCENRRVAPDGIAMAAYTMDSHNCRRIVVYRGGKPMVKNEGNVEVKGGLPYPISYRSLTPRPEECTNLLVPVCCSASHIAYGSIRMEPVFICLGQAAGLAVSVALKKGLRSVQEVDYRDINATLEKDPFQDGSAPEVVVDNEAAALEGEWQSFAFKGSYGPSLSGGEAGKGCAVFPFTATFSGQAQVYAYMQLPREGDAPATLFSLWDSSTVRVPSEAISVHGQASGAWQYLGLRTLEEGKSYTLTVTGDGTGHTRADAILIQPSTE